jgi:hypothetical protein
MLIGGLEARDLNRKHSEAEVEIFAKLFLFRPRLSDHIAAATTRTFGSSAAPPPIHLRLEHSQQFRLHEGAISLISSRNCPRAAAELAGPPVVRACTPFHGRTVRFRSEYQE